jgi:hypothetical protein
MRAKGPPTRALKEPDETVYAIIAPQSFESSLQPLVDWKTQKGVPTKVYTTEDIIGQYPGLPDLSAKVHAFLEDLENTEVNLTYVMLAGDSEIIPPRYLYTNAYYIGFTDYYAGDVYYAGLDNDWDTDDDGYYGEYSASSGFDADLNFDVTVGRLPIDTTAHVDNVVDKVLTYEKDPPVGDWVNKAEIWGTIMDAPNDPTKYDSWEDNAYKVGEKIYDLMKDNFSINKRYDYSKLPGGDYTLATDYLKKSVVLTPVNDGLSVINYAGQAWYDGTTIAHYHSATGMHDTNDGPAWPSLFSWSDAAALSNGYKMPFVFMATCDAANFTKTDDQDQERWVYADNGGAIGLLSNTGMSYRGEEQDASYGNWWLMENYWRIFNDRRVTQPAVCWSETLQKYKKDVLDAPGAFPHKEAILTNVYGYVYLGDPEVDIWTATPQSLALQSPTLYTGTRDYTFKVTAGGNPVENARICLRSPNLYTYFTTNATGEGTVSLSFASMDTVNVTVTAHNCLPKETTIDVQVAPADLEILDSDITLSKSADIKAGEVIDITVKVSNIGDMPASDTTVHFYDGIPTAGGSLIESAFVGTLDPAASQNAGISWTAKGGPRTLFISATTSSTDLDPTNNNATKDVNVLFPELEVSNGNITFDPPGTAVVGGKLNITYLVTNYGGCDAKNVKVQIYDGNRSLNGTLIATQTLPTVPQGGTTSSWSLWTVTQFDHLIYIYVNPDKEIYESVYSDNTAYKLLYVNEPPVFTKITNLTVNEDDPPFKTSKLLDLTGYLTDKDNDFDELTITVEQDSPNTLKVDANGYLNLTLVKDWAGAILVTITASDSLASVDYDMKITVIEINDAPVIDLDKTEYDVYEEMVFSVTVVAHDVENDPIQFSDDTHLFDINKTSGEIEFVPRQADLDKTFHANISVQDSRGGISSKMLTFNLVNIPDKPTIVPIEDQEVWVGDSFDVQIMATDPDSTTLTFSDDTNLFDIGENDGWIHFSPTVDDIGGHTINIWVSDDEGGTSSFSFVLTVKYNDTGDDDDDDTDGPMIASQYLVLLLIFAILLIATVIIIVVLVTKKKRVPEQEPAPMEEEDYEDEYGDDGYYDEEQSYYREPEPEPRRKSKKGKGKRKGGRKKKFEEPDEKSLEYYTDALMSQYEEQMEDGGPAEEQYPQGDDYVDKGEMEFDEDSFDEAFGDELDTEDFDPDDYEDPDLDNDMD